MDKPSIDNEKSLLSLQEVFRLVGDQLNARDVRVLKFMFSGIFTTEFLNQISDGFSFLQALEKIDRIDESNFRTLEHYLRIINRHDLFQYLTLRRRKTGACHESWHELIWPVVELTISNVNVICIAFEQCSIITVSYHQMKCTVILWF